ncbi:class I SAM-dependent methyltransferase [Actinokineospora cianjurensis]|uniref:Methyltransferase family protein n=1 Tax=Actinokineospora cianjurensis TaxID=585224 RepID=A0A421B3S8_9PSEU|nr:methyltransferase domain-containing protein [Actinokineospora cianjurensis]RLK58933.1 methyltransferase family protein [Actinokineospora cianjurensis]
MTEQEFWDRQAATLSVLLADAGHHVCGLDLSPGMLAVVEAKAPGRVEFTRGDAADPPFDPASCDVVLARHVLGRRQEATVRGLDDPALWGHPIEDERYVLVSDA